MTSATSTRAIARQKKQAEQDRQIEIDVIREVLSTIKGRRWMWNLLAFCNIFDGSSDLDPFRMAYAKGQRNVGLRYLSIINRHAPDLYIRMTNENTTNTIQESESDAGPDADSDE